MLTSCMMEPVNVIHQVEACSNTLIDLDRPALAPLAQDNNNIAPCRFMNPTTCMIPNSVSTISLPPMSMAPVMSTSCQNDELPVHVRVALDEPICVGCRLNIADRYLLRVNDELWHESCLVCSLCGCPLAGHSTCFFRDGRPYCRNDYKNLFVPKCSRCVQEVQPNELVYRCRQCVYHVQCFTCFYCGHQLIKGDEVFVVERQVVCRQDYDALINSSFNNSYGLDSESGESNRKTPKRPRTILTSQQRRAFKASFEQSPKPCRKVRETLAKETGLSVRVVQVWFQNQRAKMKKVQRKQELQKLQEARKIEQGITTVTNEESTISEDADRVSSRASNSTSDSDSLSDCQNPIDKLYSMHDSYFSYKN